MELSVVNPKNGEILPGKYPVNDLNDLDKAIAEANAAFEQYGKLSGETKAAFLETIADEILALGDELISRASDETGLPEARITGERGRTMGQLKLFAQLLRAGSWVEASIDTAIPDREPIPKPDIRKMLRPIGPVAVFTASNFPLAFSTAGGDTASALAAGNPVIVKAHNAHLGTDRLITKAITNAVNKCQLPKGVFASLVGEDFALGQKLVQHEGIHAVGFTGSFTGGKALFDLAVKRDIPIPVYAEMSSINPTILLPGALDKNGKAWAEKLAGSITLGVGQFCTNPGLVIGISSPALDAFCEELAAQIRETPCGVMLHEGISKNYEAAREEATNQEGVEVLGISSDDRQGTLGRPSVAMVDAENFLENERLSQEVFGPYSLVIKCRDEGELLRLLENVEGQLTITFAVEDADFSTCSRLISQAERKAGRIIFNGVPTGVEVCHSMVHGGPFPATTDSRTTSVGTDAIKRFARPVCYQDAPESILPAELRDSNPLGVWRLVNGEMTNATIG